MMDQTEFVIALSAAVAGVAALIFAFVQTTAALSQYA
jgi:hypothetical protein